MSRPVNAAAFARLDLHLSCLAHHLILVSRRRAHPSLFQPQSRRHAVTEASPVQQPKRVRVFSKQESLTSSQAETQPVLEALRSVHRLLKGDVGGPSVWEERLSLAQLDVQSNRPIRIGVFGEPTACPRELVDALVIDPLRDNEAVRGMLQERMGQRGHVYRFRHADTPVVSGFSFELPSTWLEEINADIVEVNSTEEDDILSNLLRTDLLLLVVDPILLLKTPTLERIMRSMSGRKVIHIAVNGHLPPGSTHADIETQLGTQCRQFAPKGLVPAVSFVNSTAAWSAQALLMGALESQQKSSSTRSHAFEHFQTAFLASRLGHLQTSVANSISQHKPSVKRTAMGTAQLALDYIDEVVARDRRTVSQATRAIDRLVAVTESIVGRANDLARYESMSAGATAADPYRGARSRVLQDLGSKLSFFNLIALGRADDVRPILDRAIEADADSDVMLMLTFNGGRLVGLQAEAASETEATLASLARLRVAEAPNHSILSSVLKNKVEAFATTTPSLAAADFVAPLQARRQQIASVIMPQLRTAAFRVSVLSYTGAFAGSCISWAVAVPPVELIQPGTALGLGLLSIVSFMSLGQRLWQRAQRSFWTDWNRTALSASEDLSEHAQDIINSAIVALPRFAAQQLRDMTVERQARLDDLTSQTTRLRERI